ncbi:hypothetical protein NMY22_g15144 [Coprinellus aureogranulatus]|nr:hypothetical protein NMY22_g15144 [Coprinellus aureogranulatus]
MPSFPFSNSGNYLSDTFTHRPSTTGPTHFNHGSSYTFNSGPFSPQGHFITPIARGNGNSILHNLELGVAGAAAQQEPQPPLPLQEEELVGPFGALQAIYSLEANVPYTDSFNPAAVPLFGQLEELSFAGSHGVTPLGLHSRSLSDSVCPHDTTGIHGWGISSGLDMGFDNYFNLPLSESAMNTPSPGSESAGSSQL